MGTTQLTCTKYLFSIKYPHAYLSGQVRNSLANISKWKDFFRWTKWSWTTSKPVIARLCCRSYGVAGAESRARCNEGRDGIEMAQRCLACVVVGAAPVWVLFGEARPTSKIRPADMAMQVKVDKTGRRRRSQQDSSCVVKLGLVIRWKCHYSMMSGGVLW